MSFFEKGIFHNFSFFDKNKECTIIDCTFSSITSECLETKNPISIESSLFVDIVNTKQLCLLNALNNLSISKSCIDSCSSMRFDAIRAYISSNQRFELIDTMIYNVYANERVLYAYRGHQFLERSNLSNCVSRTSYTIHTDNGSGWKFQFMAIENCRAIAAFFYDSAYIETPSNDVSICHCVDYDNTIKIDKAEGEKIKRLTMIRNRAITSISGRLILEDSIIDVLYGATNLITFGENFTFTFTHPVVFEGSYHKFCHKP